MSTTTSLEVAVDYAASSGSGSALLLRLTTTSFMQRGADLAYLSAFPSEAEISGHSWTVVDVVPHLGS